MKRIAQLLKDNDALKSDTNKADELERMTSKLSEAESQCKELENERALAEKSLEAMKAQNVDNADKIAENDTLKTELEELQTELNQALSELEQATADSTAADHQKEETETANARADALQTELDKAQDELATAKEEASRLSKELTSNESDGQNLADAAKLKAMTEVMADFVEELNSNVSVFRQNCETVSLCLEDIRNGTDVDDNHLAATDILKSTQDDVESIKKSLRKIRQEQLS